MAAAVIIVAYAIGIAGIMTLPMLGYAPIAVSGMIAFEESSRFVRAPWSYQLDPKAPFFVSFLGLVIFALFLLWQCIRRAGGYSTVLAGRTVWWWTLIHGLMVIAWNFGFLSMKAQVFGMDVSLSKKIVLVSGFIESFVSGAILWQMFRATKGGADGAS